MTRVSIRTAKAQFSELLDRVERGEDIAITRNGKSVARLIAHKPNRNYRSFLGCWEGKVDMSRFDEGDQEIAREFGTID